jgi:hypothetical protein
MQNAAVLESISVMKWASSLDLIRRGRASNGNTTVNSKNARWHGAAFFLTTNRRREYRSGSMGRGADAVANLFGALA